MKTKRSHTKKKDVFNPQYMEWAKDGRLDRHLASKATKRGHKHQHEKPFKSRPMLKLKDGDKVITPSMYRSMHLGKKKAEKK